MYMNSRRYFRLVLTSVLCGAILYTQMASGFSIRELLGLGKAKSEDQVAAAAKAQPQGRKEPVVAEKDKKAAVAPAASANKPPAPFNLDELQQILALVEQSQRKDLLDNEEKFKNFVLNEATNKSVYAAAQANKIDENEKNLLLAKRSAENILREIYVRQIIASKIPPDFPTEEQLRSYYEKNKDKFVVEERLPVWQIFLPISKGTPQKDVELLKKQAESIVGDLNKNKMDFATAAYKYSGHQESKFNGGFMGLVKINEMKPEIQKVLLALAPDKVSNPVTTEEGIHIFKRGTPVAKQELKLDDAREQIKKLMINQTRNDLRKAIYKQAAISYPVDIDDKRIEEWRLKLRTNLAPEKTTN